MSFEVRTDVPLHAFTTLKTGGSADFFVTVETKEQLREAIDFASEKNITFLVLGTGSNVLIADSGFKGCVIKMEIKGREMVDNGDTVTLTVGAGEILDDVVSDCVSKSWWGIENLSHIPGTVGATPVQNVGAYGVEVKDVVTSVEVFNVETGVFETLSNKACSFSYRDSIFKTPEGKKYVITHVTFELKKEPTPKITYKDLQFAFAEDRTPQITHIRDAVIKIRSQKFPNWRDVGTAGSFFKNPVITNEAYSLLKTTYPDIPAFAHGSESVKISLGYVLDKILHKKGYTEGKVSLFEHQALVLVAKDGATSEEIQNFSEKIIEEIKNKIGVVVETEVTFVK